MNTKIILGLGSVLIVGTTLFASGMKCDKKDMMGQECKTTMMQDKKHPGHDRMIDMIMHLDLSDAQRTQIKELMQNNMKNAPKPSDAFSDDSFDKALFIKLSNEKRDNKVQKQADMIESVYSVLTAPQKKELKKMLTQKREMMQKRALEKPAK
ncbi:MAG: Spy/CpxP family protein refolding chaperone [Sulfurimonas sp.]|nr:Spy/CpxP family protein refolding chaperone [Sulfurimonas sp.]